MPDLIDIFGEDFSSVLASLDELPPQVEDMLLGVMDKMVYDVRTFSNSLEKTVFSMNQAGVSDDIIKQTLANDMGTGGRIFGQLRNDTKASIVDGINQSAKMGQYKNYDLDKGEFVWVAVGGHKVCMDCDGRAGQKMTFAGWEAEGLPGSGWSVCQGFCYCVLDPTGKASKKIDAPVKEPGRKVKPEKTLSKEDYLTNIGKHTNSRTDANVSLNYMLNKAKIDGTVNFAGVSTESLGQISNALSDTLGRFNLNVHYVGKNFRGLRGGRGASASAYRIGGAANQSYAITIKPSYLRDWKKRQFNFANYNKRIIDSLNNDLNAFKNSPYGKKLKLENPTAFARQTEITTKKIALRKKMKRWGVGDETSTELYATVKHESWHQVDYQLRKEGGLLREIFKEKLKKYNVARNDWYEVSEYGGSSVAELWAETGTAIDLGIGIPPNIKKAFIEVITDQGYDFP